MDKLSLYSNDKNRFDSKKNSFNMFQGKNL